jgi:hypothetical protein
LLNQLFHRSRDVFDRHVGVNAVLIEQIDDIGLKALQRGIGDLLDVLWPTIQADLFAGVRINFPSELGGDRHLVTERSEGLAHELFICECTVDFGGVKECDAAFDCRSNQRDPFLLVHRWPEAETESHAPQPQSRNFQVAFPKFAFFAFFSFDAFAVGPDMSSVDCLAPEGLPISREFLPNPPTL